MFDINLDGLDKSASSFGCLTQISKLLTLPDKPDGIT